MKRLDKTASLEAFKAFALLKRYIAGMLLLAFSAALFVACETIPTKTPEGEPVFMNKEQFAAYVEHVFRHHNNVVDESLFVSSGQLPANDDPVKQAEMRMLHACQPLNDAVSSSVSGQSPDFWAQMKLADAVPDCEIATRRLEKLLTP